VGNREGFLDAVRADHDRVSHVLHVPAIDSEFQLCKYVHISCVFLCKHAGTNAIRIVLGNGMG
jgi:hypothetical protein